MPQKSSIEWTDYTSNAIYFVSKDNNKRGWFCAHVSEGCRNCYAEVLNKRFGNKLDFKASNAKFVKPVLNEKELTEIIKLNTRLGKKCKTAKMFPFDMTDLFLNIIPDEMRDTFFAVVALCDNITFQVLTKRAKEMRDYFTSNASKKRRRNAFIKLCKRLEVNQVHVSGFIEQMEANNWVLPNVWLGVSVEDHKTADERIPLLVETPAAVRWLSIEPLLSHLNLNAYFSVNFFWNKKPYPSGCMNLNWVVVGGESGINARPMHPDWVRSIRDSCQELRTPFFFKQWGKWKPESYMTILEMPPSRADKNVGCFNSDGKFVVGEIGSELQNMIAVGKGKAGRLVDGREWNEFPKVKL